ncbi:MAG: multicopper oxidase domain-containing protein [Sulfuricella sp.]|nr:multicopper oxidase domain-containing protein [Sulfuricella sp.]
MITRRQFLNYSGGAGAGLFLSSRFGFMGRAFAVPLPGGTLDPATITKFAMPLVVLPAMPQAGHGAGQRGAVDRYEIAARQFRQQVLPAGLPTTTVWGYGAPSHPESFHYPAYTIEARYRIPLQAHWINELKDDQGRYLPHLLPVDPTLHWANPGGGISGRDQRPVFSNGTPGAYSGPIPLVTHLHGGHSADDSDGYPSAWVLPDAANIPDSYAPTGAHWEVFRERFVRRTGGREWRKGSSVYQYENDQRATTLWYHDHALGMTRLNMYAGLMGLYNLRGGPGDEVIDAASGLRGSLPGGRGERRGRQFEIPLIVQDRSFNADGSLFYPDTRAFFDGFNGPYIGNPGMPSDISPIWNPEFFGNTMVVNGRTWPYLEVEPRRYRFRVLNNCGARFLILRLDNGAPFWQIGSDGGFLPAPVKQDQLLIAPAERADLIVDFGDLPPGATVTLLNVGPDEPFGGGVPGVDFPVADSATTGRVMQFRVVAATGRDTSTPPERLKLPAIPALAPVTRTRQVSLNEMGSMMLVDPVSGEPIAPMSAMLGTVAADPASGMLTGVHKMWGDPVSETPQAGTTEIWEIYNFTEDAHPIHVHQVMFEVVNREIFDPMAGMPGTTARPEAGEQGRKDTVIAYPGQITRLRAHFDLKGLYVWHCHILEHEDNEMMRPMQVV